MKTLITIKFFASLTLTLIISVATNANAFTSNTGDIVKPGVKKQIIIAGAGISNNAESDFNYLRFDLTKFGSEPAADELPASAMDYVRFDVNNFIDANKTAIGELPLDVDYRYLRFDVNKFIETINAESFEFPIIDFEYLRFDVLKFTVSTSANIDELPANEL